MKGLCLWIAIGLLAAIPMAARAQYEEVIHEKPVRLRHLAGKIVDPKGLIVPYAYIELRSAADHHVLATSFADGYGKFAFAYRKFGETLEIRVSMKNFDPVQYHVVLHRIGFEELKVVLPVAT